MLLGSLMQHKEGSMKVELTQDDVQFLIGVLNVAPISGNRAQATKIIMRLNEVIAKLEAALKDQDVEK